MNKYQVDRKSVIKNSIYSLSSNMLMLITSVLLVICLPKMVSVEDYGGWQLYVFYASYIGFMHFGWEDGLYLRYAGYQYNELDKRVFRGQISAIMLLQIFIAGIIFGVTFIFVEDLQKKFILISISIALIFTNFNNFCYYVFQMTNQIVEYSLRVIIERMVFVLLIMVMFLEGFLDYKTLLYSQIIALICVAILSAWTMRDLLYPSFTNIKLVMAEAKENLSVGSKLMLSNIASLLIIGIIRYGISANWNIVTFGKVSLVLSISNFFMVAINAGSVVLFPILKKLDATKLGSSLACVGKN